MAEATAWLKEAAAAAWILLQETPLEVTLAILFGTSAIFSAVLFGILYLIIPQPRPPTPSEKKYKTVLSDGTISKPAQLPCWIDTWRKTRGLLPAELFMSVVVPAYNEAERLPQMLEEAVTFLDETYAKKQANGHAKTNGSATNRKGKEDSSPKLQGWEIIIVSDGSKDATVQTALDFAKRHQLVEQTAEANAGPTRSIRVVELERNRGKGGAVTHGMKHVRGQYAIFADADGASKFEDLEKMVTKVKALEAEDQDGRAVVVGSRAHLVGSEAVVKRSKLRNMLMYTFHLFIRLLTTAKVSQIGDTQCGFKLFTRPALPHIIPYMHTEGWIFDVEMLMLTESAGIPMQEVPVGWREVPGSKLNVIWDSLAMAWGLATVRAAWSFGIWTRT